jgi:DNA-binding beta-propeller fold protein YncE
VTPKARAAAILATAFGTLFALAAQGAPPSPCDRGPDVLQEWNGFDSRHPEFRQPTLIAVDPSGSVYLLDQDLYLVRQFSPEGVFLKTLELPGEERASFMIAMDGPTGCAVDRNGNLYVTDMYKHRVVKFDLGKH